MNSKIKTRDLEITIFLFNNKSQTFDAINTPIELLTSLPDKITDGLYPNFFNL